MSRDTYLDVFYKNRKPIKPNIKQNISPYQHKPLNETLGHSVSEGEVQAFNRDTKNRGFVLPFDKYLGPGNSVNRGEAKTQADRIAQIHDIRYFDIGYRFHTNQITKEQAHKEIIQADKDAIAEFSKLGTFDGIIGHDGLTFKRIVEKIFGVQYPNIETDRKSFISGKRCLNKLLNRIKNGGMD